MSKTLDITYRFRAAEGESWEFFVALAQDTLRLAPA